jgi:hypothetical protein
MSGKSLLGGALFLTVAFAGGMVGSWVGRPGHPLASPVINEGSHDSIVGTFGVGGVLNRDGRMWQYRPDKKKWISLDESFALEGQATNTSPLPVPVSQIRFMETFGFLVADDDQCWLYNIEQHRWESVGHPPMK